MEQIIFYFTITLFVLGCAPSKKNLLSENERKITIVENVNIFTGEEYLENTSLVFTDKEILTITKDISEYSNATLVDGTNKTIIPPLINAHVHLFMPQASRASLRAGVFANLDMHNTDDAANSVRLYNDSINYAKYYSSNAAATVPKGHGTQFGMGVPTINDSVSATQFVEDRVNENADYIKVIKEIMLNTLTDEQSKEAIDAAHSHNILAVGHSHRVNETRILTEQGIDGLMHIWFDLKMNDKILSTLKDLAVFIVPTLLVTQKALKQGERQGWAQYLLKFDEILEEVKKAHLFGIPILCGTDAPNLNINYTDHLFVEMALLSKAGLSNIEVLKSATTNVYKAFRLKDFDELKTGSQASFILVDGYPLKDLDHMNNTKAVYKYGKLLDIEYLGY